MGSEQKPQEGQTTERDNVLYLRFPRQRQDGYQQALVEQLQTYAQEFGSFTQSTRRICATFRECLRITPDQCNAAIEVLQAARKRTATCLEFLQEAPSGSPLYTVNTFAITTLQHLDGEETARLVLDLDRFKEVCDQTQNAQKRITQHIDLQMRLEKHTEKLKKLTDELQEAANRLHKKEMTP